MYVKELKTQLEGSKQVENDVKNNLNAKEEDCTKLSLENEKLKKDLVESNIKLNNCLNFEKISKILSNRINSQRPS